MYIKKAYIHINIYVHTWIFKRASNLFLVSAVVAYFGSESTTRSGSFPKRRFSNALEELASTHTHTRVDFVILRPRMP